METRQFRVPQIKIFNLKTYNGFIDDSIAKSINDFCAQIYGETKCVPKIECTSTYVAVTYQPVVDVQFQD